MLTKSPGFIRALLERGSSNFPEAEGCPLHYLTDPSPRVGEVHHAGVHSSPRREPLRP